VGNAPGIADCDVIAQAFAASGRPGSQGRPAGLEHPCARPRALVEAESLAEARVSRRVISSDDETSPWSICVSSVMHLEGKEFSDETRTETRTSQ